MEIIKASNLVLKFLLELAMLASFAYWGFIRGKTTLAKYALAIVLVAVAIALWAYLGAPKSAHRLPLNYRLIFEVFMFGSAAFLLYNTGHHNLAFIFAALSVLCILGEWFFKQ